MSHITLNVSVSAEKITEHICISAMKDLYNVSDVHNASKVKKTAMPIRESLRHVI